jgi:hypothetical protein
MLCKLPLAPDHKTKHRVAAIAHEGKGLERQTPRQGLLAAALFKPFASREQAGSFNATMVMDEEGW